MTPRVQLRDPSCTLGMSRPHPMAMVAMSSVAAAAAVLAARKWYLAARFRPSIVVGQPVSSSTPQEIFNGMVNNLTNAGVGVRFLGRESTPLVVTEAEVLASQSAWASAIKKVSKVYLDKGDYVKCASDAAAELYGYGFSKVLFKPTKASHHPFRPTDTEAMSYFVGGSAVPGGFDEDAGFAINGGKGWSEVVFNNHQIDLNNNVAIAMGSYSFTCATTGNETKVEYTFGYKKNWDGKVRIFLHHSSVPYQPEDSPRIVRSHLGSRGTGGI